AEIGKITAETAQIVSNAGVYTQDELRKVTTNSFVELGVFPGIDQAVAETDAAGGFDLGGEGDEDDTTDPEAVRQATADAAPRTLYVRRDVLNAEDIIAWAKGQGFETVQDG